MKMKHLFLALAMLHTSAVLAETVEVKTVYSPMGGSYLVYNIMDGKTERLTESKVMDGTVRLAQVETKTMSDVLEQVNVGQKPSFNKLKTGVLLSFPAGLKNVKDVANYFLTISGYSMVIPAENPEQTGEILLRKPSDLANTGKLSTVEKALLLVSGTDTKLLVDHKNKYVTFVKEAQ